MARARAPRARRESRKVKRAGVALDPGHVYFLDGDGDVAYVARRRRGLGRSRKLLRLGLVRDPGYLYFIDGDGDVARVRLAIR